MLTYTMNSTIEQLQTEGFVQLEFSCKDCRKVRNRWLSDIEDFLTLRQIQASTACGSCGQATQYLKPLQTQHSAQISEPIRSSALVPLTPRPATIPAKRIDDDVVAEISDSYSSYLNSRAHKNVVERLITSGRKWEHLSSSEQRLLIDQEVDRIRTAQLVQGGKLLASLLLGVPTFF